MATVKDVPSDDFITALAAHFKSSGKIELPQWHDIVKTGVARELPPLNPDWFYVRAGMGILFSSYIVLASLARKVYCFPGRGVGSYSKVYGGHKRNGVRRGHQSSAATGIIRNILRQLEKSGFVSKGEKYVF